jgi:hypothetical protein
MNFFGEDLDSGGQSRSTDAGFSDSAEAANEIFTVYLCTSSDAQSSKRRWLKRTANHHDATALKGRI